MPPAKDKIDSQVIALSKEQRLESGQVGEGGKSKAFQLYRELQNRIAQIPITDLMWLTANGTAASRVYSAFLTRSKNTKDGAHCVLALLDDDSPVKYQSGCEIMPTSVSEIGSAYVATGTFLDFKDKADLKPIYFEELKKAEQFADQEGSEGGRYAEFLIFRAAYKNAHSLKLSDLKLLQKSATPAGRLYASILLERTGSLNRQQAFAPLLGDNSTVTYMSGCKGTKAKVSDVAKQLKTTGRYHNFDIAKVP